jgi:hypothetical protein
LGLDNYIKLGTKQYKNKISIHTRVITDLCSYRVPGNSAMVTALEEELNTKSIDDINFEEPV